MPVLTIDDYQFGKIIINGIAYTRDVIILPSRVLPGWWRKKGHLLYAEDLAQVLEAKPQFLVIGTGANDRMKVDPGVEQVLRGVGIDWKALPTREACREYNLRAPGMQTAAALHLTC